MTNPLLNDAPLPAFGTIEAAHVEPAIRQLLDDNRAEIAGLLATGADRWDTLVVPLERMHHRLAKAWSPVGHLNGVMNGDELRAAYNACLPLLTAYHTELGQNAELCAAYQGVADREGAAPRPGAAQGRRERTARLPPGRRVAARRPQAALRRGDGAAGLGAGEIRRERARRHQCLVAPRHRGTRARGPARQYRAPREGGGGSRGSTTVGCCRSTHRPTRP